MAFGLELKRLRKEAGVSVQKLADILHVDPERMRQWERKDLTPRLEDRQRIEAFFLVSLERLSEYTSIKDYLVPPRQIARDGEGKILRNEDGSWITFTPPAPDTMNDLLERLDKVDPVPKNDAIEIAEPNQPYLRSEGIVPLGDGRFILNTPLIPIKAYASYLVGWGDSEFVSELPVHPIIVDKPVRGEYRSFEVKNDSMVDGTEQSILPGSIVTGRRLDRAHWRNKLHLKKFKDYVIVSIEHGIIVKQIIEHDTAKGEITCHSLNPDKRNYPDFILKMDKLIQLFNIVSVTQQRKA